MPQKQWDHSDIPLICARNDKLQTRLEVLYKMDPLRPAPNQSDSQDAGGVLYSHVGLSIQMLSGAVLRQLPRDFVYGVRAGPHGGGGSPARTGLAVCFEEVDWFEEHVAPAPNVIRSTDGRPGPGEKIGVRCDLSLGESSAAVQASAQFALAHMSRGYQQTLVKEITPRIAEMERLVAAHAGAGDELQQAAAAFSATAHQPDVVSAELQAMYPAGKLRTVDHADRLLAAQKELRHLEAKLRATAGS